MSEQINPWDSKYDEALEKYFPHSQNRKAQNADLFNMWAANTPGMNNQPRQEPKPQEITLDDVFRELNNAYLEFRKTYVFHLELCAKCIAQMEDISKKIDRVKEDMNNNLIDLNLKTTIDNTVVTTRASMDNEHIRRVRDIQKSIDEQLKKDTSTQKLQDENTEANKETDSATESKS